MVSKYPSNTKQAPKGQVAAKPGGDFQGIPKPAANDNKVGVLKLPPLPAKTLAGLALRRIAPRLAGPAGWALTAIDAGQLLGIIPEFTVGYSQKLGVHDDRYWALHVRRSLQPCAGGYRHYYFGALHASDSCNFYSGTPWTPPQTYTTTQPHFRIRYVGPNPNNPPNWWGQYVECWYRRVGAPDPTPVFDQRSYPLLPLVSPYTWPLAVPLAYPYAAPNAVPNPQTEPDPASEPSQDKQPDKPLEYTLPFGFPFPFIRIGSVPVGLEVFPPSVEIGFNDGMLEVRPVPNKGRSEPPGNSVEVQKKNNVAVVGGIVWTGLNTATEAFDFIVAMHKSLPKAKQLSAKDSKRHVILYMLKHPELWRTINIGEALQNFISMQLGDMAAAFGSTAIKQVQQQIGGLTGLDKAIRDVGDLWGEVVVDQETGEKYQAPNLGDLIPTLDIDSHSGEVTLTFPWEYTFTVDLPLDGSWKVGDFLPL